MASIEKTSDVDVPVTTAYSQWTQFEEFPLFMEGVKEVRQIDAKNLRWEAEIMGKAVTWTAEITEQIPDRRIAWRSTSGAYNAGAVSFAPSANGGTRVTLALDYEPEGMAENTGAALGLVSARVQGDLDRFKEFIEERGVPTGRWRGEIQGRRVTPER